MKRLTFILTACAMLLLPIACNDIVEDTDDLGRFAVLEVFVDKTQTNKYSQGVFCHEWEYETTQMEIWVDGQLMEIQDNARFRPYTPLELKEDWTMVAQGMNGKWLYSYNHLFIDCLGSGGSNYVYQVAEVTPTKLVLREEDWPVGGPIAPFLFHNNPAGRHAFYRFIYTRKLL